MKHQQELKIIKLDPREVVICRIRVNDQYVVYVTTLHNQKTYKIDYVWVEYGIEYGLGIESTLSLSI